MWEKNKGFEWAIEQLKNGSAVTREGWNGKNQFIKLASEVYYSVPEGLHVGGKAIIFFGTSGVQVGWLASQGDMLAEDWGYYFA